MVERRWPDLAAGLSSDDRTVLEAWAKQPGAVGELARELSGEKRVQLPDDVSGKEMADRLTEAVITLARTRPDEFWDEFSAARWAGKGLVARGIGEIDTPEACALLVVASQQDSEWCRMDATIGLGKQTDVSAVVALVQRLDDPEYLVRYHALQGLRGRVDGEVGVAIAAFRDRVDISDYERRLSGEILAADTA